MAGAILVTGASSGIGRAVAERFLEEGWQVGLLARRAEPLEEMALGRRHALALPADVTDEAAVDAAFARFDERFGRIDVLFNNAGVFPKGRLIDEIPVEEWQQALAVNLTGMFLAARAAFRMMRSQRPQGGRIINNGSISAHAPRPLSTCYTTTKHAITGLTKTLSLDGRSFDIACGQIDIGNARTPLIEKVQKGEATPQPLMELEQVASSVLHMATMPPEANVQFMTVMATKMPFIGRG